MEEQKLGEFILNNFPTPLRDEYMFLLIFFMESIRKTILKILANVRIGSQLLNSISNKCKIRNNMPQK